MCLVFGEGAEAVVAKVAGRQGLKLGDLCCQMSWALGRERWSNAVLAPGWPSGAAV